ncbi:MAG: isoprenoid biosynthesis glyoxalase ElbB [Prolixibacteraceae bacterium]|jgi:enhancing lycopene biosynthesis protein 2|nr:isoprenoid biosynthesis glyoxalase ElbB [Prolixibacteraceae bacterium]
MNKKKRFAVVLAGCGVYDGAEIQETVLTLLAIDKTGSTYQCFSPNINQYHVINHFTGEEMNEKRNVLVESARIARGNIKKLTDFNPDEFDAIVFPGGFGAAKNLCTFAIDGADCLVNPVVEEAVLKSNKAGLPIGALCISPVLIVCVLGKMQVTIGVDKSTAEAIENMGATHKNTDGSDIVIDEENKIVTSPCYMNDASIGIVAQGAENVIKALYGLM